ncbi:hypothetical protein [uncultured Hymenobacter sp.]|uniref:hypothetical protein n=1 Tax=uncultured Hymenobacter sp. TaxID=170016 RepID=UPI0035CCA498
MTIIFPQLYNTTLALKDTATTEEQKTSNSRTALWTVCIGAVFSCFFPWLLTREYIFKSLDFTSTGQIGDTIGGIAGPLLNFTGLLVVYFSLQEQFRTNQDQTKNFKAEQRRSNNETAISSAFKIIDDLRKELDLIAKHQYLTDSSKTPIAIAKYTKPAFLTMWLQQNPYKRAKTRYYPQFEYLKVVADANPLLNRHIQLKRYIPYINDLFTSAVATFNLLRYFIENSTLPDEQKKLLYNVVYSFYEPFVVKYISRLDIFSSSEYSLNFINETLFFLDERLNLVDNYKREIWEMKDEY